MRPERALGSGLIASVSRETTERLEAFCNNLVRWSKAINLVSESTYDDAWSRHILDSLQILDNLKDIHLWADIGSGGGLPAIPLAIVAREIEPDCSFVLIESDRRKAAFLKTQIHTLGLNAQVLNQRCEALPPIGAQVLSARAFAPLGLILEQASRHLSPGGRAILHKGSNLDSELDVARALWHFDCRAVASMVQGNSVILHISNIRKKADLS